MKFIFVTLFCGLFFQTAFAQLADDQAFNFSWKKYAKADQELSAQELALWRRDIWSSAAQFYETKLRDLFKKKQSPNERKWEEQKYQSLLANAQAKLIGVDTYLSNVQAQREKIFSHQGEDPKIFGISNPLGKKINNREFDKAYVRAYLLLEEAETGSGKTKTGVGITFEDQDYVNFVHAKENFDYLQSYRIDQFSKGKFSLSMDEAKLLWPKHAQIKNSMAVDSMHGAFSEQFSWASPRYRPLVSIHDSAQSIMTPEFEKSVTAYNEAACQCVFGENGNELKQYVKDGVLSAQGKTEIFGRQHQLFRNTECFRSKLATATDINPNVPFCYAFASPSLIRVQSSAFEINPEDYDYCVHNKGNRLDKVILIMPWVGGFFSSDPGNYCRFNISKYRNFIANHPPINSKEAQLLKGASPDSSARSSQ